MATLTTASFLYAANQGSSSTPTITVPATAAAGSIGAVLLSQGSTDAVTAATPTGLTVLDTSASSSANLVEKWWTFTVGDGTGGTVAPGSTISWGTLSASRQWAAYCQVAAGVTAVVVLAQSSANLTTMILPTATTDRVEWITEVGVGKANGTQVTAWTPPTGLTIRATATSGGTFGPSIFAADTGVSAASGAAVGGETYTPNQAIAASQRYLLAWRPSTTVANPTVNAGVDKTGLTGQTISIAPDATVLAASGGTLTGYAWTQVANGAPNVTIANATSLTGATFTPTTAATYQFRLTATQTG
jgi:hypothetical protein